MKGIKRILSSLLCGAILVTSIDFTALTVQASTLVDSPLGIITEGNTIDASDTEDLFGDSVPTYSSPTYSSDSIMTMSVDSGVALLAANPHTHFVASNTNTTQHVIYDQPFCIGRNGFIGRTYTLSFSSNRGSSSTSADSNCTSATAMTGNLGFNNWKITSGSTSTTYPNGTTLSQCNGSSSAYNFTTTHNSTVTLTAQWYSATLTNFTNIYMPGYKFGGWWDAASGGSQKTSITVSPATTAFSQTLYAHWTPYNYKFAYDYNRPDASKYNPSKGANFTHASSSDVNKNGGADTADFTFDGTFHDLPTPTLTGWTFEGWYLKVGSTYKKIQNGTVFNYNLINSDRTTLDGKHGTAVNNPTEVAWTIVASWRPNTYTVKYLGNYNTSGQVRESYDVEYDTDYTIKNNDANWTNFGRQHTLSFDTNGGSSVSNLTNTHTFADWLYFSTDTYTGDYILYNSSDFNGNYDSSRNHLDDTYDAVGIPYWGRTESNGDGTKAKRQGMNYNLGSHFNEGTVVRNLTPVDGGVVELYAQWQINRVELPDTEKLHFKFISWYLQDQESTGSKGTNDNIIYKKSTLLGNAKDLVYILQDTIAYAWFNQAPIFADIYEGQFFEGQNVTVKDLLSLVSVYDYEDDYYNTVVREIYKLPSVDQSQIYVPIHTDADVDNEDQDIDGEIPYEEIITIDGMPYRFDSEKWEKTSTDGVYKNKITGKLHYTVEAKMKLEEDINASNLVLRIKSIEYEYKDGVAQTVWDVDSEFAEGGSLAIYDNLKKVDYTEEQLSRAVLDTSTSRFPINDLQVDSETPYTKAQEAVGKFKITYQVTDNGVWNGDTHVDDNQYEDGDFTGHNPGGDGDDATTKIDSAITLEYTRLCSIQYNNVPLIYLRDVMLYEGSEDWDSILAKQIVIDAEDCIHNPPFWYKAEEDNTTGVDAKHGYTYDNLQASLHEVGIWGCILDDAFLVDYPSAQEALSAWEVGKTTKDLEKLKGSTTIFGSSGASEGQIYSAIIKFNVEFDAVDQWGKHSSGYVKDGYTTHGVAVPRYEASQIVGKHISDVRWDNVEYFEYQNATTEAYWQTQLERSITVHKINTDSDLALTTANVAEKVRYIDREWFETIYDNSYWGDASQDSDGNYRYGYDMLNSVLKAKENTGGLSKKTYSTVGSNKNGHQINITVEDYTDN